jgi:type IV fimbrial biogenesis protein FimT
MMRQAGFTLVELLMTVALAAILLGLAAPGFRSVIQNNRATALANEMITTLNLARSEAVKRGVRVTVCRSSTPTACAASGGWEQGWITFLDGVSTDTGTPSIAATDSNADGVPDAVLNVHEQVTGGASVTGPGTGYVRFLSQGQSSADVTFTLAVAGCSGDQGRTITVSATGRISVARTACE